MNIVFMGTPDFAVPSLLSLVKSEHKVLAVFTQPDKPKGRGYTLTPPPVKVCAAENNIPVYQPEKVKDGTAFEIIKELAPDVIVVVAYGKILPKNIIDYPKYGCINVHGSLLPKYRGAAPIQWAVLNGESETGVTTMLMNEGLDTGDILLKSVTKIGENETSGELFDRLMTMGADLLLETLDGLSKNKLTPIKQDDSLSTYASVLDKSLCQIDWNKSAVEVHNKVRGLSPWPVAVTMLNGKRVKIHKTEVSDGSGDAGEIISLNPLTVACKSGAVKIITLQLEGKKAMDSKSFLAGHKLNIGEKFG